MAGSLFWCDGDQRHMQASTNGLSDVSDSYRLFRDRMIPGAGFTLLQRQAVQMGSIEAVRRRLTVETVADERQNTLFADNMDRISNKPLFNRVMRCDETNPRFGASNFLSI
jgi:hypothetical protein